ncbi:hypothetical protein Pryu01_01129 [Paraliobacillus ryukyuensis]|uniref:Ribosomal-protein-alanine N-acetyltransferase n=1 Tax=Paraliobacillus ryukyuensis TaxID=200904 RepID=A0A366EFV1_9BACI|nr:GNAT family protein [Paraliobacillus ryukyuensis]RBP00299.1 ribosomal-protein-alanine N-acetyltransferase [Paraliobacillus ryukyuensis]
MTYQFTTITQAQVEMIAFHWHYDGIYSFYDMESDPEDLVEFTDPNARGNVFAVTSDDALAGFLSIEQRESNTVEIGLGMRPDLTGIGLGADFLAQCLAFIQTTFSPERITLAVATFNQRAIKTYRKIGFVDRETFMQATNGDTYEFVRMEYLNQ